MLHKLRSLKQQEWQVLLTTWLGTFFDGLDASIFILALYPTFSELLNTTSHAQIGVAGSFVLAAFMVGWAVGAAFFGMLADRLGRLNTMVFTILLYAICTGLCATSHNCLELGIYRFFVGCGIGGEISVGAVFLAETWKGRPRYLATGMLSSAFGFGYLTISLLNFGLGGFGWRALYIVGMLPAFLTIYIRLKLKESSHFTDAQSVEFKKARESLSQSGRFARKSAENHPLLPFLEVFNREYRSKTLSVMTLACATIVGYWAVVSWIPAWVNQLTGTNAMVERSTAAAVLNIGAILGAIAFGAIFDKLGTKNAFLLAFVGSLVSCIAMFLTVRSYGPLLLTWVSIVGLFTVAPFVVLCIYVPELFPTQMRVTAFGICVQSGRLCAAAAAIMAGQLIALFGGSYAMAGSCVSLLYLAGIAASLVLPRSSGEVLPVVTVEANKPKSQLAGAVR